MVVILAGKRKRGNQSDYHRRLWLVKGTDHGAGRVVCELKGRGCGREDVGACGERDGRLKGADGADESRGRERDEQWANKQEERAAWTGS